MGVRSNLKHFTMPMLLDIRANQYRSKDASTDFCPFEVESRIHEIGEKHAEAIHRKRFDRPAGNRAPIRFTLSKPKSQWEFTA